MDKFRIVLFVLIVSLAVMVNGISCKKTEQGSTEINRVASTANTQATTQSNVSSTNKEKQTEDLQTTNVADVKEPVVISQELPVVPAVVHVTSDVTVSIPDTDSHTEEVVETSCSVEEEYSDVVYLAPSFEMGTLSFNGDGSITDFYRYGMAVQAKVTVSSDCLVVDYSAATITGDDIESFINGCAMQFPELVSQITYEILPEKIIFHYAPELMGGTYYKLLTLDYLNTVITKILDEANHTETVYMSINENNEKTFSTEFTLFGKECYILATNTNAEIYSSSPFTAEELEMIVGVCLAVNSDLQYAVYEIDDECMKVSYPAVDDLYIKNAVASINNLIRAYTPAALPLLEEVPAEVEVESVKMKVAEEENSSIAEVSVNTIEDIPVAPIVSIVEKTVEPIKAVTDTGKKISFNSKLGITTAIGDSDIDLGISAEAEASITEHFAVGIKTGYNLVSGSIPFIPYVKGSLGNAYLQAGAGFSVAPLESFKAAGLLELALGYEFPLEDQFSVFAEAGVRVYLHGADKPSVGGFAVVGGNIKF